MCCKCKIKFRYLNIFIYYNFLLKYQKYSFTIKFNFKTNIYHANIFNLKTCSDKITTRVHLHRNDLNDESKDVFGLNDKNRND